MPRTTRIVSLSLPPKVARMFERMARSRRNGKSGLFREMIEMYRRSQWLEDYKRLQNYGARKAREARAFTEADIDKLVLGGR
ncbi:MAG: hypothetical protein A2992_07235 [Elusimicrobia bacterium RIFCSPLOWO2_01_FULL_59_12]|nr:MAG: hypothetical protein A2992_07235 [Elusimicrobia bacterium RIFCSPLOWO2_01_FULL_59_12]